MRLVFSIFCCAAVLTATLPPENWQKTARGIFQQLIEINTEDSDGSVTDAVNAMAARFRSAGFPATDIAIVGEPAKRRNLIVRYRGSNRNAKPILLLAHLDVVEARRSDWSMEPFKLTEQDGFFYGRGTDDDKAMAAAWVANLLRYKAEGYVPARDLIVALTAGEESGIDNGVDWLVKNRRPLIDAEYCLNEGGGARLTKGKHVLVAVQAAEKTFVSFHLIATNSGGHSSQPSKDNAIYHVADALTRVRDFDFPAKLTEVTQAFFERMSKLEMGDTANDMALASRTPSDSAAVDRLARSPFYNAQLRTTCVATMIAGGHAENALPQSVDATVNCRVLPGQSIGEVREMVTHIVNDPSLRIEQGKDAVSAPPSQLSRQRNGADAPDNRRDVARCASGAHHVHRCHRWQIPAQRGHPHLRRERAVH